MIIKNSKSKKAMLLLLVIVLSERDAAHVQQGVFLKCQEYLGQKSRNTSFFLLTT